MRSLVFLLLFVGIWLGSAFEFYHYGSWQCLCLFVIFLITSHLFTTALNKGYPDAKATPPTHFNY